MPDLNSMASPLDVLTEDELKAAGVDLRDGEEITAETLDELSSGKGDDE